MDGLTNEPPMKHYKELIPLAKHHRENLTDNEALAIELIYSGFNQDYIERLCDLTPSEYSNINDRLESLLDKISNGDRYGLLGESFNR